MTKFKLFRLKNEMLITNYIANSFGLVVVIFLTYRSTYLGSEEALRLAHRIGWFFEPFWIILMFVIIFLYERPIRYFLNASIRREPIPQKNESKARQRLLNEPFFLITDTDISHSYNASNADCPVPDKFIHWQAAYCMWLNGTDESICSSDEKWVL